MKYKYLLVWASSLLGLVFTLPVNAVCPICVVAVGAGLGFSRWLGVDDVVSSIWIGALLFALSVWTIVWIKNKKYNFKFSSYVIPAAYYLLTLIPLYYSGIVMHPLNTILGVDKILFGVALGSLVFGAGNWFSNYLKSKNQQKPYFPYQKVVLPVTATLIASLILFFIPK